jgi:hypothetical protein
MEGAPRKSQNGSPMTVYKKQNWRCWTSALGLFVLGVGKESLEEMQANGVKQMKDET